MQMVDAACDMMKARLIAPDDDDLSDKRHYNDQINQNLILVQ